MARLRPLFARLMIVAVLAAGVGGTSWGVARAAQVAVVVAVAARPDRAAPHADTTTARAPDVATGPPSRTPSSPVASTARLTACWPLARSGRDIVTFKRARLL